FNWFTVTTPMQREAESGTNNGGVLEGGGDSGSKIILNSAGDSVCWTNVNMAGIASARLHYGNGETSGDSVQLTYPNTGTVIGTFSIASTGGWSTPNLTDANVSFVPKTGTGELCIIGQGSGWIASVDYVYLQ
ncbi:MAG: carbohydrate-binding protein, partial [Methanomicrobiales archaeon]|nr:carbohydrate-binding protein [Methanomicrobiales archaeon]